MLYYFLSMFITLIFPLWHYYYLNSVMLKQTLFLKSFWNLNDLAVHDFLKVSLIRAFIASHNFSIICLSKRFQILPCGSTVPHHDENFMIEGYSLLRADHPSKSNCEGVCLYFKEHLPLIRRNDLSILQVCLVTEIIVNNENAFSQAFINPRIKIMEI